LLLEVKDIYKKYRRNQVLRGASFAAQAGCCVGLLGGNGSGKSTLLSILAGVLNCDGGQFLCDGQDLLKDEKAHRQLVGYVPQGTPLMGELSAWDNLLLWYDKHQLERELEEGVLNMLGIGDFIRTRVNRMSGGMKKRLSIGCAVARDPRVLLLDEASAALDLECKEKILSYFYNHKQRGGVIIMATHDVQELSLCESCYVLKNGVLTPYDYDGNVSRLVENL